MKLIINKLYNDCWTKKIIEFSFNQNQVIEFANITGDNNPIHLNDKYARNLFLKKDYPWLFVSKYFSRALGTIFPGEGTIYLKQTLFLKNLCLPMLNIMRN